MRLQKPLVNDKIDIITERRGKDKSATCSRIIGCCKEV